MIAALLLGMTLAAGPAGQFRLPLPAPFLGKLPENALVYLVMVDRFNDASANAADVDKDDPRAFQGGDLRGVIEALPHLRALGVTHIWLTPLHQQIDHKVTGTAPYHGYWPALLDDIDPHFGTVRDYQALIAAAEESEIGIILDVVTNHLGYGAPDPEHLVRTVCGDDDTTRCLFGLPDLATEDPRVRAIVVEQTAWWAKLAMHRLRGMRFDAFKHVDRDTAKAVRAAVAKASDDFTVVAEDWGATVGDANVDDIVGSGAADAVFDFGFYGPARDFLQGRMRSKAFAHFLVEREQKSVASTSQMLVFLDNHDIETWTHAVGLDRSPIGAALLLSDRQIPVVTWGTEVRRMGGAKDPDNRTFMPWDDVAAQNKSAYTPLGFWWRTAELRREHAVLRGGALRMIASDIDDNAPHFLLFERADRVGIQKRRALVGVALDRPLRHVQPMRGASLVDVAGWHGRAHVERGVDGDNLVVDVDKDGAVVVILTGGT